MKKINVRYPKNLFGALFLEIVALFLMLFHIMCGGKLAFIFMLFFWIGGALVLVDWNHKIKLLEKET